MRAGTPRHDAPTTAWRSFVGAAIAAGGLVVFPTLAWAPEARPTPYDNPIGNYNFRIEIRGAALATRRHIQAAFQSELSGVEVAPEDVAGAIDHAVSQLAGWTGKTAIRGCAPSGRLCYVIACPSCGSAAR